MYRSVFAVGGSAIAQGVVTAADTLVTMTDTVASRRNRMLTDTIATVTGDAIAGGKLTARTASDTLTTMASDTIVSRRNRALTDTASTVTDSLVSRRNRMLTDTLATVTGDSIAKAKTVFRTASDTAATMSSDTLVSNRRRMLADTLSTVTDSLVSLRNRRLTDTATTMASDAIASVRVRALTDTLATMASDAVASRRNRQVTDTLVTFSDSLLKTSANTSSRTLVDELVRRTAADNFNRADENPLAGIWLGALTPGETQLQLTSNQVTGITGAAFNGSYTTFTGPDCEAYATLATIDAGNRVEIYARVVDIDPVFGMDGYCVSIVGSTWSIRKKANSADTQIGATATQAVSAGDSFGIRITGTTIEAWYKPSAGSWTQLFTRTDSDYQTGGYLGLRIFGTTHRVDDFSGGDVGFVSDTVASTRVRALTDTAATVTDSLVSRRNRMLSDTAVTGGGSDSITKAKIVVRSLTDTAATVTDSIASRRNRQLTDTIATVTGDSIAKSKIFVRTASDTIATVTGDSIQERPNRQLTDTLVTPGDSIAKSKIVSRTASDTLTTMVGDSISRPTVRVLTDTLVAGYASDNFNRANGTLGSPWVQVGSSIAALPTDGTVEIVSNAIESSHPGVRDATAYYAGAASSADQFAEVTLVARGQSGPAVRLSGTDASNINMYLVNPEFSQVYRVLNGDYQTVGGTESWSPGGGDVCRIEVSGTTIRVFKNGVEDANSPYTDANISSGQPGVRLWEEALDTWSGGDLAGSSDSITRTVAFPRAITDTIATVTDSIQETINRRPSDTLVNPGDSITSLRNRQLSDTAATVTGDSIARTKTFVRTLSDTAATVTDAITSSRTRRVSDTLVTFSDTLVGGLLRARTTSDTITTITDSIAERITRVLTDTAATVTDTLARRVTRVLTDTIATVTGDTITKTKIVSRALTDTASTFTDSISVRVSRSLTDTAATLTDSLAARRVRQLTDTLASISDSLTSSRARQLSDTAATVSDTLASRSNRMLSDTAATVTDATSLRVTRALVDTLATVSDQVTPLTHLHPVSDVTVNGWHDAPLYEKVDENDPDTGDWIESALSPVSPDIAEMALTPSGEPTSDDLHKVGYMIGKDQPGGDDLLFTIRLVQGTTVIQSWQRAAPDSPTVYMEDVTNAASITDYADLRLRVEAEKV